MRDGKLREFIFVEGMRLCEEAIDSGLSIEAVIYSEHLARKDRAAKLISRLERVAIKSAAVSEKLLESISFTTTPQGIIVLARRSETEFEAFAKAQRGSPLLVILHEINNPVNVGAIVRAAEAAGVSGVIATAKTADPFSPKALRGAMGSVFRLPIWNGCSYAESVNWCHAKNIQIICAAANGQKLYTYIDWRRGSVLIVARESVGFTSDEVNLADHIARVPMQGRVESLNVAVATGIILYEAARQREQK